MTKVNQNLENPVTGHRVMFLQTGDQTDGRLLQLEYIVPSKEEPLKYIPLHFHAAAEERFETVAGRLGVMLGGKDDRRILEAGDEVTIPPGTVHAFWNEGNEELRFITDVRPAGRLQTYWETAFGLAAEGKVNDRGIVGFWQIMALYPVMDTYSPGLPLGVQQVILKPLSWISNILGYRAAYPEYSSQQKI